ncbi:MAG: PhoX family protein [Proteobacteria bacterium]|nr:PhoX family protein [Pseudomonadota bacterium]
MRRRDFLRLVGARAGSALGAASLWTDALASGFQLPITGGIGPYGPLRDPDENGIMLPEGFASRVLARAMEPVPGTNYVWKLFPDGGDTFWAKGGHIYVSNSEFFIEGGVNALRFDRSGNVIDAYSICDQTFQNCAGGRTPWGTWLTCEELANGRVFECDPTGRLPSVYRPALGTFQHEAVAVDGRDRQLYLTEDRSDGAFYRFTPSTWPDLSSGLLEVAQWLPDGTVVWHEVPEPNPEFPGGVQTRHQVPEATAFRGGEGIVYQGGNVFFTTKLDNRVWNYHVRTRHLSVLYDAQFDPERQLTGVDNINVTVDGDLLVAEDGGNMELVLLGRDGVASPVCRVVGQDQSEITGPALDPRGQRLYFSSQRGDRFGITYEITGPFGLGPVKS